MAGKRNASSDLNHDNWDKDDEPEEAGTFKKASETVIKNRVIKTARRRNPISSVRNSESEEEKKNVFGSFSFNKASASSFEFLDKIKKSAESKTNGVGSSTPLPKPSNPSTMFKGPENNKSNDSKNDYYAKLKGLNESVSKCIKKHVDANPFLNLMPVFNDYEKYLDEIEKSKNEVKNTEKTEHTISFNMTSSKTEEMKDLGSFVFKSPEKSTTTYSFKKTTEQVEHNKESKNTAKATETSNKSISATFKFGVPDSTTSKTGFSFGNAKPNTGFTFGGANSTPYKFGNVTTPTVNEEKPHSKVDEDNEDPPKVEFKEVQEDGHIYKIRCKVFVKKEGNFADRGVGNLFLKPVADSEKVQLIVRADTNLGNLLCNFILSESIPIQKLGQKDVMLVCLPTPDFKPPPVPILLRVKTPEDADNLFRELEKNKR